jgi:hypothetical protein
LFAEQNLKPQEPTDTQMERKPAAEDAGASSTGRTERTYNLTVDKDHVYYAHGLLVSNCDMTSQALARLTGHDRTKDPANRKLPPQTMEEWARLDIEKQSKKCGRPQRPVYS